MALMALSAAAATRPVSQQVVAASIELAPTGALNIPSHMAANGPASARNNGQRSERSAGEIIEGHEEAPSFVTKRSLAHLNFQVN